MIGNTSKDILKRMINDLILEIREQGLGSSAAQTMFRDRLKSQWHREMRYRVDRIVRTETTSASNWGSLNGVLSTGLPHIKQWLPALDERTRAWHIGVQSVDADQPFSVNGAYMMHPGDPNGGAENVINCRCAMTYTLKR